LRIPRIEAHHHRRSWASHQGVSGGAEGSERAPSCWLGEIPLSVQAMGRSCIIRGIPDVAFLNIHDSSGINAELEVSWLSPVKLRRTVRHSENCPSRS